MVQVYQTDFKTQTQLKLTALKLLRVKIKLYNHVPEYQHTYSIQLD